MTEMSTMTIPQTCEQCGVSVPVKAFIIGGLPDVVVTTFTCRTCSDSVRRGLENGTSKLEVGKESLAIESWRVADLPHQVTRCSECATEASTRLQLIFNCGRIVTRAVCSHHLASLTGACDFLVDDCSTPHDLRTFNDEPL
jgi:hypothetical protein